MPAHDAEHYKRIAIRTIHSRVRFVIMWFSGQQRAIYAIMEKNGARNSAFKLRMKFLVGVPKCWRGVASNVTQSLFDPPLTGLRRRVVGRRSRRVV